MPFLNNLTADWDHLPTPQSPTPTRWQIALRKTMEALRPTFTYGDERDTLERRLSRRRQREITKDEHKLKVHERREKAREARRRQQGKTGLRSLADKVQFRKSIFVFATPSATKAKSSRKPTSTRKRPSATKAPTSHRSRSSPQVTTHRPPAPRIHTHPVTTTATTSSKGPRVIYVTTSPVRPQPKTRGSNPSQRQHVTVHTLGPQRSASKAKGVPVPSKRK